MGLFRHNRNLLLLLLMTAQWERQELAPKAVGHFRKRVPHEVRGRTHGGACGGPNPRRIGGKRRNGNEPDCQASGDKERRHPHQQRKY